MTEDFLNKGSFEDPFNEYFIRDHQLVRDQIPVFLQKEAPIIFRTGQAMHFLNSHTTDAR